MRTALKFFVLTTMLALGSGCAEDAAGFNSLVVKWEVQGTKCSTAGIVNVRVELKQSGVTVISESGSCAKGSLVLEEVPEGVYDIVLVGLDENSKGTFEGRLSGVRVKEGAAPVETSAIQLAVKKGELMLMWILPTAKPCSGNDIYRVEATLWRGEDVVRTLEFYCDPGSVPLDKTETAELEANMVRFEEGYMVFWGLVPGTIRINLFGISSTDKRTAQGELEVEVPKDGYVKADVQLEACQHPCQ